MTYNNNSGRAPVRFILQPGEEVVFDINRHIISKQTKYQNVQIVETKTFGKAILLDDKPQSSEIDQYIFNEVMVHPAMILSKNPPESVLILGGGPGGCLNEVTKYSCVKNITMCDIDEEAVELYRNEIPEFHQNSFDDKRLTLVYCDARKLIENEDTSYDLIIVDTPDPVMGSPATLLYTEEFYKLAIKRLKHDGALVTQAGRFNINNLLYHSVISNTLNEVFVASSSFYCHIPFYAETWAFAYASDTPSSHKIDQVEISRRIRERLLGCLLRYYDDRIHLALFAIPRCISEKINQLGYINSDSSPMIVE